MPFDGVCAAATALEAVADMVADDEGTCHHYTGASPEEVAAALSALPHELEAMIERLGAEADHAGDATAPLAATSAAAAAAAANADAPQAQHLPARVCSGSRDGGRECRGAAAAACALAMCRRCCLRAEAGRACAAHRPSAATAAAADAVTPSAAAVASFVAAVPPAAATPSATLVRSAAHVLLVGTGADELLAGYSRHRSTFARGGWPLLAAELASDASRLWLRNLGRDDRVLSASGKEARAPFLDEGVVALLRALPLALVADLRLPHGVGDKALLRAVAALLGLRGASVRVKRAMHMGSGIVKKTNARVFGATSAARASGAESLESLLRGRGGGSGGGGGGGGAGGGDA